MLELRPTTASRLQRAGAGRRSGVSHHAVDDYYAFSAVLVHAAAAAVAEHCDGATRFHRKVSILHLHFPTVLPHVCSRHSPCSTDGVKFDYYGSLLTRIPVQYVRVQVQALVRVPTKFQVDYGTGTCTYAYTGTRTPYPDRITGKSHSADTRTARVDGYFLYLPTTVRQYISVLPNTSAGTVQVAYLYCTSTVRTGTGTTTNTQVLSLYRTASSRLPSTIELVHQYKGILWFGETTRSAFSYPKRTV